MFIMDDILLRQLGISIPGIDTLWTIEQIKNFAHKELYNPEKIKSKIKENRMLFEFGALTGMKTPSQGKIHGFDSKLYRIVVCRL